VATGAYVWAGSQVPKGDTGEVIQQLGRGNDGGGVIRRGD